MCAIWEAKPRKIFLKKKSDNFKKIIFIYGEREAWGAENW